MSTAVIAEAARKDTVEEKVEQSSPWTSGPAIVLYRNHFFREWLIPTFLCALLFGELFFCSRQLSQTSDEATHLYSGYRYLKCGDLTLSPEHPPLVKVVAAAPLLLMKPRVDCTPFQGDDVVQAFTALRWFYSQNWRSKLFWARTAVSIFAVGLCLLVWGASRRMFGFAVATAATVLTAFEPNVLASGALVMTDLAPATMMLCAVFIYYLWTRRPSGFSLLLTGLAVGLTLLSKTSGVVVIPIILVLAAINIVLPDDRKLQIRKQVLQNLFAVGLIFALAFAVLWIGYCMRYATHSGPDLPDLRFSAMRNTSAVGRVLAGMEERHMLPQAYLEGFGFLTQLSEDPPAVFILGKMYAHAQWFFFPLNMLIRSTAAFLVMIVLSCAGIVICWKERRREILFLIVPGAMYAIVCVGSGINSGIRHLLPIFPFLIIVVCAGCVELSKRWRWMKYAVPGLIVLHAASSLHAFPDYLSYANELWGGPARVYKYLPGVDLGQSYLQVRDYMERHPSEKCWLLTDWQWNPEVYGVRCKVLGYWKMELIPPQMSGTIILSSTALTTPFLNQAIAAGFEKIPPQDYIGGSAMLVFRGDFDTRAGATASAEHLAMQAIEQGRFSDALQLSEYAIRMSPENPYAHLRRANALTMLGQTSVAINELEEGRRLMLGDPVYAGDVRTVDGVLQSLRNVSGGR